MKNKIVILQRVCPNYRVALFRSLTNNEQYDIQLFIGADIKNTKVKSAQNLDGIRLRMFKTILLTFFGRVFVLHVGLLRALIKTKPQAIICEAESNILSYLKALIYKLIFNNKTKLFYWCYVSLPGKDSRSTIISYYYKYWVRKLFDGFILYSSYGKNELLQQGISDSKIFVATNVGDTQYFLRLNESIKDSSEVLREKLGLPNYFTVLYVGTLDSNKKPDMMLELAKCMQEEKINFVVLGSGPLEVQLKEQKNRFNLDNLFLLGKVTSNIGEYYKAADVLLVPGRGGIAISEALCFGLPVIVHQADGTEYDLVNQNKTGIIVRNSDLADFRNAIKEMIDNTSLSLLMGKNALNQMYSHFNTDNMANVIIGLISKFKK